jgi:hypothetical protein
VPPAAARWGRELGIHLGGHEFCGTISVYSRRLPDARHVSHSDQETYDGATEKVGEDVFERERMAFRGDVYRTVD